VKNLDYVHAGQNLLKVAGESVVKWIHPQQVKDVAVLLEAQLQKGDWLALN